MTKYKKIDTVISSDRKKTLNQITVVSVGLLVTSLIIGLVFHSRAALAMVPFGILASLSAVLGHWEEIKRRVDKHE